MKPKLRPPQPVSKVRTCRLKFTGAICTDLLLGKFQVKHDVVAKITQVLEAIFLASVPRYTVINSAYPKH